jgi:translation initiation factor 3 subunit M
MSSFTTLVSIDASTGSKLALFLASKLSAKEGEVLVAKVDESISQNATKDVIDLFLTKIDIFLGLSSEQEVEASFQALFSLLYTLGDESNVEDAAVVSSIVSALTADASNSARRRLTALLQFLNLSYSANTKYELLIAIYNYAKASNQLQKISTLHEKLCDWIVSWGFDETQQQTLYRTIVTVFFEVGQKKKALDVTVQFLKSLDDAISAADAEAVIKPALLVAIKSNSSDFKQRANLFEALGMQRLPGDLMTLSTLLRILCDGSVTDWKAFIGNSSNEAVLKTHDISVAVIERKVRIFTLASLAADAVNKTLTFAAIASAMQISEEDVEEWVVEAISEGVVQAAINQMNGTVTVHRFVQRSFGPAQWRSLGSKLESLKSRLQASLEKMGTSAV